MKPYREMSKEELASLKEQLTAVYKEYQGKNLSLNMARGKPSPDQLDLSLPMLDVLNSKSDFMTADGDVRNYGVLTGIQEAKELMGGMMDAPAENDHVRKRQPYFNVRYRIPFLYPRRNGKYALVQAGQGEIPLPGSRL